MAWLRCPVSPPSPVFAARRLSRATYCVEVLPGQPPTHASAGARFSSTWASTSLILKRACALPQCVTMRRTVEDELANLVGERGARNQPDCVYLCSVGK